MKKLFLSLFILLGSFEVPLQLYNAVTTHIQDEFSIVASDSYIASPDGFIKHHVEQEKGSTSFGFISSASAQSYLDFLAAGDLPPPVEYEYSVTIAGQSNTVGLAATPSAFGLTGVISNAKIYNPAFGHGYESLEFGVNNQGNDATHFGYELSLGKYMSETLGRDVYLHKYGINGAALADVPGGNDFAIGGTQYNSLVGRITTATNALPESELEYKHILLWIQGERDGQGESGQPTIYSSVYDDNWFAFIAALEADIGFEYDMIIISRLSKNQRLGYLSTVTGFDQVYDMHTSIVATGGARYKILNTDNGYTFPTDAAHYNNHGCNYNGIDAGKIALGETIPAIPADPSWAPNMYSGVKLWLDAKQGVTLTSGKVSQWDDQSGNNYHATQSNASIRPTYNGTDAIIFNANGMLDLSSYVSNFVSDTQGELIIVMKRTNTVAPTDWLVSFGNSSNDNFFYSIFIRPSASSNPDRIWSYKQNNTGAGSQIYDTNVIPSNNLIISVANNGYGFKVWQNGNEEDLMGTSFGNVFETNWLNNFSTPLNTFVVGGLKRTSNLFSKAEIQAVIYVDHMRKYEERVAMNTFLDGYY